MFKVVIVWVYVPTSLSKSGLRTYNTEAMWFMDLSDRSSGLWTYEAVNFWVIYEGESNENLKFVIKNRNFAPLSCELVSVLQTACRMACRW